MDRATNQRLYHTARWLNRARLQLRQQPLCRMCLAQGVVEAASVADHIIPHRGDEKLFWFGELQSLCTPHHNRSKQQLETRGYHSDIGIDGWPLDPGHMVYSKRAGGA
jgi:5-methylcytosine-specific restriction protein A